MEKNTQMPAEVTEEIKLNAEDFANKHINGRAQPDVWEIVFKAHETSATAYASKLHQVEQENAELRRQNAKLKQQATGWRPLLEDALRENNHTAMYPDHFIDKIKKFLYGE